MPVPRRYGVHNASLGWFYAMAYQLGGFLTRHMGMYAVLLPRVQVFNSSRARRRDCAAAMGVNVTGKMTRKAQKRASPSVNWRRKGISRQACDLNVKEEDIPVLATNA